MSTIEPPRGGDVAPGASDGAITPASATPISPTRPPASAAPTRTTAPTAPGGPSAAVARDALTAKTIEERARGRGLRLGDGLDALFVRELQQVLSGRIFAGMIVLSLLGMLIMIVGVLADTEGMLTRGSSAFAGVLGVLCILVCAIVPLQAFFSTRQEAVGEPAESLLLTRLSPWAIVRGKLTATNAHMLMWVSVAAPLLALTWLLRGVSVSQILLGLLLACAGSTIISSLAVAIGTLARFERLSGLVNLFGIAGILSAAFGWTSFTTFGVTGTFIRIDGDNIAIMAGVLVASLSFAILVARSQFTHPFENRSTHFRVLLPAAVIVGFLVMAPFIGSDTPYLVLLLLASITLFGFLVFAATEEDELSPWLARRVPKTPTRAGLAAPFLPGGARGLLWGMVISALIVVGLGVTELRTGEHYSLVASRPITSSDSRMARTILFVCLYAMLYGCLGALVRPKLRRGTAGNWIARSFVLGFLVVMSLVPMVFQFLLLRTQDWTPFQLLNPSWTIADQTRDPLLGGPAFALVAFATAMLLLVLLSRLRAGVTGIVAAGEARRAREG